MNFLPVAIAHAVNTSPLTASGKPVRRRSLYTRIIALVAFLLIAGSAASLAGPILTIELGRSSRGCTGFGICRIIIERSALHAVPANADIDGDRMRLQFLAPPGEKEDVLVIDEDIVLDGAASRALGYKQVTVRKGEYTMNYNNNPNGVVVVDVQRVGITIYVEVGRRSKGCTGFGICSITIDASARTIPGVGTIEGETLGLDLLGSTADHGDVLTIDEDIVLDRAASLALGYQQVVVRKGDYPVDYSSNPNGHVNLNVETQGISITIWIGRSFSNCRGFGICRIDMDFSSEARTVSSVATVAGDKLAIDFLGAAPDQGEVLTIDEDITLDKATSLALGYQQLVVRKGEYRVDYSNNPNGHVEVNVARFGIGVTVEPGRRSKGCTGFGICSITIDIDLRTASQVPGSVSVQDGKLSLDLLGATAERGAILPIDEDIVLDEKTSLALGYKSVTIKKGSYPVDYSINPNGHVELDMVTAGISITIWVGRPSDNCSWGFGICRIDIDLFSAERAVPSVATIDGNTMSIDFLALPPDHGDVLTIDEDIVLDKATSLALGYQQLTIKKGTYNVDYSSNPNGHVNVNVARFGITITIDVGSRYQGCTGFGICSITIETSIRTANQVLGSMSVQDGKLSLDLLGATAERGDILPIDEDIVLDEATSRALGHKSVTIKKGRYPVDYSSNPNGHVELDIETVGIVIHIKFGRRNQGCTGFGICAIWTTNELTENSDVRAIAVVNNGRLEIELLDAPGETGEKLVIDEDIVLDAQTAAALGFSQLTVESGEYTPDYSSNPNGSFSLATSTPGTSGVDSEETVHAAGSLQLATLPNPFSGATTFNFMLAQSANVTATLVNVQGVEVVRLVDGGRMEAGQHAVSFDASVLPEGVYFYTVRTGGTLESRIVQVVR